MIAIASDHGGFELKEQVKLWLKELDQPFLDMGCYDQSSVDYPDLAKKVVVSVSQKSEADRGILICGTGIGMSIAANRMSGIRATLVSNGFEARMSREHNDSNVLVMGGRVLGLEVAKDIVKIWVETEFEGDRHQRRLDKIEFVNKP